MTHRRADPQDLKIDVGLVVRMARGDMGAMREFYVRHGSRVAGFARRLLGDAHEAEDAAQDVFVRAWKRAADFDEQIASPWAWLAMMTRSVCVDRLRYRNRRPDLGQRASTADAQSIDVLPDLAADHPSTAGEDLEQLMTFLKPSERICFTRIFFDGLTQAETAATTGLPLGSVKTHLRRGLERLRRALSTHES